MLTDVVNDWLKQISPEGGGLNVAEGSGFAALTVEGIDCVVEVDGVFDVVQLSTPVLEVPEAAGDAVRTFALELNLVSLLPAGMGLGLQPGGNELVLSTALPASVATADRLTAILVGFVAEAGKVRRRLEEAALAAGQGAGDAGGPIDGAAFMGHLIRA